MNDNERNDIVTTMRVARDALIDVRDTCDAIRIDDAQRNVCDDIERAIENVLSLFAQHFNVQQFDENES